MSCSNGRRHRQVGGGKRSHATLRCCWKRNALLSIHVDAPPNSLKDSNANLKVKTMKGVGVCSLVHNTSGVRRTCWSSGMRARMNDKQINYLSGPTQTKQQVG